jgi:hypothetical protein
MRVVKRQVQEERLADIVCLNQLHCMLREHLTGVVRVVAGAWWLGSK